MLDEFEQFYSSNSYVLGNGLEQFENEYANYNGVKYAIGVGNGHGALLIALKCLNIGVGDEIILPAHTFIASALPVLHLGATPVLIDIDPDTLNIDVSKIVEKINENTRAIIPVHLYGNPCDMDEIRRITQKYSLSIIEDNAQAHGAEYNGKKTGSFGIINFVSFYPTKNLGALGDGGMITTDSDELTEKAIALRNNGKTKDNEHTLIGFNSRLDELQARMLSIKLKNLDAWNNERIKIAHLYEQELKEVEEVLMQKTKPGSKSVHHIFPILAPQRDALRRFLFSKGIDTRIHYPKPLHLHPALSLLNHPEGSFPIAEKTCSSEISLPIYPGLASEDVSFICQQIKHFFTGSSPNSKSNQKPK